MKNKLLIVFLLYPLVVILYNIISGYMAFWYDPARDLLQALQNIHKPTLIGPPTGIPGIFYGPYWIWLLTTGVAISRDPRVVVFLVLALPYLTLFPFMLYKLSPFFSKDIWIILFFLFVIAESNYLTQLWNIYPAPLLFLLLIFLLIGFNYAEGNFRRYVRIFSCGFINGLIVNFHFSFGIAVFFGVLLFFGFDFIKVLFSKKEKNTISIKQIFMIFSLFISGFVFTFIPTLLFEYRHGFNQVGAIRDAVLNGYLYNSASVGQIGINKLLIIKLFLARFGDLLQVSGSVAWTFLLMVIAYLIWGIKRNIVIFSESEKRFILLLSTISFSILFVFLSSKNPIWAYHLTGVEVIMLLLIGFLTKKIKIFRYFLITWSIILLIMNGYNQSKSFFWKPHELSSLSTKKYITQTVFEDAGSKTFTVFSYSPSIYTYEYDYLFKWLGDEIYHRHPVNDPLQASIIYLIIPQTSKGVFEDFIQYKSPHNTYETIKEWKIEDGTTIIKRTKN